MSDSAPVPFTIGQKISHYEITGKIGEGGMGAVYKAVDINLGRTVAIKVISRPNISTDDKRRFAREAKAASALNHPNIVTIYEYNSEGGIDYIAMEYVEGKTLDVLMEEREAWAGLPMVKLLDYARQVASALAKAHAAGIAHRDLKPGNIMITGEGVAKVLDFGLAKHEAPGDGEVSTTTALTLMGVIAGTPAYMSPEQAMGEPVDYRSDIFSFGIILYEMVCGVRPFTGSNPQATLRQIMSKDPAPVRAANPSVPQNVGALVERCLHKDKQERPASMADMVTALNAVGVSSVSVEPEPVSAIITSRAPSVRRWKWVLVVIVVMAVGAASLMIPTVRNKLLRPAQPVVSLPKSSQDWYAEGMLYLSKFDRESNRDKAIESFNKAIELEPQNAAAYVGLAEAYLRRAERSPDKQWTNLALESAKKAVQLNSYLASAHAQLGLAFLRLGQISEAEGPIDQALKLDTRNAAATAARASLLETRGDIKGAEVNYRKAASLADSDWAFQSTLAAFFNRMGRYPDAVAAFEGALRLYPDNAQLHTNLGALYHLAGRDDDAAAAFQKALQISPSAGTYTNLGTLLYYRSHYKDAAAAFERAVSMDASTYTRWGNLADAYRWEPGLRSKSVETYQHAIQLVRERLVQSPTDGDLQSTLATYLAKSGDDKSALAQVAAINPGALKKPAILFKIALVYEIGHDRTNALALLQRAVQAGYPLNEVQNDPEFLNLRKDPAYHRIAMQSNKP